MGNVLFSYEEIVNFLKRYEQTGYVTVTRFSKTAFTPIVQKFDYYEHLLGEKGCFAFIHGFEDTDILDHKKGEWYTEVPYWMGKINMDSEVLYPGPYDVPEQVSEEILRRMHTATKFKFFSRCAGVFIPESVEVLDVREDQSRLSWKDKGNLWRSEEFSMEIFKQ